MAAPPTKKKGPETQSGHSNIYRGMRIFGYYGRMRFTHRRRQRTMAHSICPYDKKPVEESNNLYYTGKLSPHIHKIQKQMDLLVDSNIAYMFGPEDAALYFARLLKVDDVRSLHPTMSQEWPHAFFITSPTTQNPAAAQPEAPPTLYINRTPTQLLDYTIRPVGTVVPQAIWPPGINNNNVNINNDTSGHTSAAPPRSANPASLNMPIFFVGMDRVGLGLPLCVAIAEGDRLLLQGAGSRAPIGHGSTMYIRITWPGYGEWATQIMTRDQTPAQNTITLGKFAKRLASAVGRFMEKAARRLPCEEPNWRIGGGGITKEQVILIGAVHVTQGSWQPILQLNRYVFPRYQRLPGLSWS